ncbi:hypothetical protein BDW02DRAFT_563840 [Decorospora gaudefroyi]|uniref:Uncharacterized protein n=1 Tax=Decorospora gaudefroyi TaxID=184978 RepID=A0A6A5KY77_9PLEO|nr:hypothetical protein BDW02DRAFT_563840 [Decorospora gaudefroyi]
MNTASTFISAAPQHAHQNEGYMAHTIPRYHSTGGEVDLSSDDGGWSTSDEGSAARVEMGMEVRLGVGRTCPSPSPSRYTDSDLAIRDEGEEESYGGGGGGGGVGGRMRSDSAVAFLVHVRASFEARRRAGSGVEKGIWYPVFVDEGEKGFLDWGVDGGL